MAKISKWDALLGGFLLGVSSVLIEGLIRSPNIDDIRIYSEQGKQNVMRLYKDGKDGIMVEDPREQGYYITLKKYNRLVSDEYKKRTERAR